MTDDVYCPWCHRILENDGDLFPDLFKRRASG